MATVGMLEGCFYDQDRSDWSGKAPRPLQFTCWYPAAATKRSADDVLLGPPDAALFKMGWVVHGAALQATQSPYRVVLISHGTGASAAGMGWLGCRLAAQGFVALGIRHHGNTVLDTYLPQGFLCWWERARDLSVALDQLFVHPHFQDRLDTDDVLAAGFSLGGYTVIALAGALTDLNRFGEFIASNSSGGPAGPKEFPDLAHHVEPFMQSNPRFRESQALSHLCYLDPRVRAVFACAPAPTVRAFTDESLVGITLPVSIICGRDDRGSASRRVRLLARRADQRRGDRFARQGCRSLCVSL